MFVIDLLMRHCVVGLGKRPTLHTYLFIKVIVKLYVISDDGTQAAVAELRRANKLEDEVKEGVKSFIGGFEESVTM